MTKLFLSSKPYWVRVISSAAYRYMKYCIGNAFWKQKCMKNVFLSIISVPCTVFFKKGKISSEKQAKTTAAKQEHSKKKLKIEFSSQTKTF